MYIRGLVYKVERVCAPRGLRPILPAAVQCRAVMKNDTAARRCNLLNLADDGTVSFVHAVEGAHCQHGPFGTLRGIQKLLRMVMHSHNANLGAVFRLGRTICVPDLHA